MKNIFKKSLALLLALSMFSTLPMVAFATEEEPTETLKMTYDFAEAFAVADNYDFSAADAYYNLSLKNANSESSTSPWKVGEFNLSNGQFEYNLGHLTRQWSTYGRAPEDTVSASNYTHLIFSDSVQGSAGTTTSASTYRFARTGDHAYVGYSFGQINNSYTYYNSHPGSKGKYRGAVRFIVPRDGTVSPSVMFYDATDYVSMNDGTDGVFFRIYKLSNGVESTIYGGDSVAPSDSSEGWENIPGGQYSTYKNEIATVKAGDEIVLQFDPNQYHWSDEYIFHSYILNYVDAIASYDEITNATYDATAEDKTIDLRVEKYTSDGSIEYTKVDTIGALRETTTPGVYTLEGVTNYDGVTLNEPVVVTASYFASGESSEQGDTPISTTSTTLYISSVLAKYEPFGYETIQTTDLDMEEDSFFLPYYVREEERALYGTIDLKLHERWAGSTVTFDKTGYLEYVGDGKVRVIGLYDHSQSAPKAVDSTDKFVTPGDSTLTARRDENTIGTPIKMTVTAPDGYSKSFNVLTFKAIVQDTEQYGSNVYRWVYGGYRGTSNRINNAVMSFETMHKKGDDYRFESLVPDPGKLSEGVLIPIQIAGNKYTDARSGGSVDTYCKRSISGMGQNYITLYNGLYIGSVGVAQTFTAPLSGKVELSSFIPDHVYTWQSQYIGDKGLVPKYIISLYDANDNLVEVLYKESFGPVKVDGSWIQAWDFYGDATYGKSVAGTRETGSLTFNVEKGQKVRVMFEMPDMSTLSSGQGISDLGRFADPIFTYLESEVDTGIVTSGDTSISSSTSATIAALKDEATCAYFAYDDNGKMIGSGFKTLDAGTEEIVVSVTADAAASCFKVYLWEDLSTLKTIGSTLILK